jgi:NTE family protein
VSKAVVLSGGGSVGIGWQTGLLAGLTAEGMDFSNADAVFGTSAGSAVGAQLALGHDLNAALERFAPRRASSTPPGANGASSAPPARAISSSPDSMQVLLSIMAGAMAEGGSPKQARAAIGRHALKAETISEEDFLHAFEYLAGEPWPRAFSCTAVDTESGGFKVWNQAAGVELVRAVTSSCAVPGLFPPITIEGRRYMDGGMRTGTNADLAKGHTRVMIISLLGAAGGRADRMRAGSERELALLREGGAEVVETVTPSEEAAAIMGMDLMNPAKVHDAAQAGLRQGRSEAARLREVWA